MPTCPARLFVQASSHSRLLHSTSSTSAVLTLLHKASTFVPKVLTGSQSQLWKDTLNTTYDDVLQHSTRPSRIVVYGLGERSGASEVVTATLDEPLKPESTYSAPLRSRWASREHLDCIEISYGNSSTPSVPHIQIPSSFLLQFPNQVRIMELSSPVKAVVRVPIQHLVSLNGADIPIVVWNPLTTHPNEVQTIPLPVHNPNMIFAVTATPSPHQLPTNSDSISFLATDRFKVVYLDPNRALHGINKLRASISSPSVVQTYQDDLITSNISLLKEVLKRTLDKPHEILHIETALSQIRGALLTCRTSLRSAKDVLDSLIDDISSLEAKIEETQAKAQVEVFGRSKQVYTGGPVDDIQRALKLAERDMKQVLDRLSTWRMLWKLDEVGEIVNNALLRLWCKDLEKQLILQTGRLAALQETMSSSVFNLLSAHEAKFNSPVLKNKLLQLIASPTYTLSPTILTSPLQERASQIHEYTTPKLHVSAQIAVIGMSGGVATGLGIAWASWLGWLTGAEVLVGMDIPTCLGLGGVLAATSVRWAVGKWDKAKRRWWDDWHRVGSGLDRDLKATLHSVVEERVTIVAREGLQGLQNMADARRVHINLLEDELEQLIAELESLQREYPPPSY
ncbi:hypothetical protein AX16_005204 [Volvariella volvacea WC 439]|nr:hypothetical protein AX16_005204 [Volvariella volvacea WC 439]